MKNQLAFLWGILVLLINLSNSAYAACSNATVPSNFSTWNWEETPYDASGVPRMQYCNTWQANIATGSAIVSTPMDAPWVATSGPAIQLIGGNSDYKKADGWELIRFDFGGTRGSVPVPYFILYHKPTGVLRIFAYIASTLGLTGATITMSHSNTDQGFSGHSTASLGLSQTLLKAPDKYLEQSSSTNSQVEQATYVCFLGGRANWTMAQFTMLLDPSVDNQSYSRNSYQIQISGMIQSTVKLEGAVEFQTKNTSDFSFGGPAVTPQPSSVPNAGSGAQDFTLDAAQKFLGDVASIGTKISDINDKADKTVKGINANNGVLNDFKIASQAVKTATDNSVLKAITGVASQLGGVFGLVGSVIGLFSSDKSSVKTAFIPTFSKGTITMSGTITTQPPIHTFFLLTPGTKHYDPNSGSTTTPQTMRSQLPYYDCSLGIFNISNTPILQKIDYQRVLGEYLQSGQTNGTGKEDLSYTKPYTSYSLTNDIKPIINPSSGLEVKSVKIAIAQKIPMSVLSTAYTAYTYDPDYPDDKFIAYNFIYSQISSGALEVYPYDPGKIGDGSDAYVIIQSPFVEASCIDNSKVAFNIPTPTSADKPVYLRVIAELHKVNTPTDSAPVYFAQDYAVGMVSSPVEYTETQHLNTYPPFKSISEYNRPANLYVYDVTKTGNLIYDENMPSEISNRSLVFNQNSSVTVHLTNRLPVLFHASQSIGIEGTLAVQLGERLTISTDPKSIAPTDKSVCNSYAMISQSCNFNTDALRVAEFATTNTKVEASTLVLVPNPSSTSTVAQLTVPDSECIQLADLINIEGQHVWRKEFECVHNMDAQIPLSGLHSGVYILRVTTSSKVYTSKLAVE